MQGSERIYGTGPATVRVPSAVRHAQRLQIDAEKRFPEGCDFGSVLHAEESDAVRSDQTLSVRAKCPSAGRKRGGERDPYTVKTGTPASTRKRKDRLAELAATAYVDESRSSLSVPGMPRIPHRFDDPVFEGRTARPEDTPHNASPPPPTTPSQRRQRLVSCNRPSGFPVPPEISSRYEWHPGGDVQ